MNVSASEFKAKCLALIDRVHETGESITITKRGRVVARLVSESGAERPWLLLREGRARWIGDPFAPVVAESDVDALK